MVSLTVFCGIFAVRYYAKLPLYMEITAAFHKMNNFAKSRFSRYDAISAFSFHIGL